MIKKLLITLSAVALLGLFGFSIIPNINKSKGKSGGFYILNSASNEIWLYGGGGTNITGDDNVGYTFTTPTSLSGFSNDTGFITASSSNPLTNKTGNISMWTNNLGYITSEVDGSTTNEIELPSQSGQSGRYLQSNGASAVWATLSTNRTINNAPGRSIVATAAAANGWQISSTRDADVSYSTTIGTSVSLSGNSTGYVVLEIAATNSTTASDWKEISRVSSGQSGTLVVGLVLNQTGGGVVTGTVPAGWYCRIRSVNTSGTPTYTANGQQEVY